MKKNGYMITYIICTICLFASCNVNCIAMSHNPIVQDNKANNSENGQQDKGNDNNQNGYKKIIPIPTPDTPIPNKAQMVNTAIGDMHEIEVKTINLINLRVKAKNIFLSDPDVADIKMINDKSLYLMGLKPGNTTLLINDAKGNVILNYRIRVTYPLNLINESIDKMFPDASVHIASIDDSVILKGSVPSAEIAADIEEIVSKIVEKEKIINRINIVTSTQVMLKVKIAEVTREVSKNLGVSWRAMSPASSTGGIKYGMASGSSSVTFGENAFEAVSGSTGGNTAAGGGNTAAGGGNAAAGGGNAAAGGGNAAAGGGNAAPAAVAAAVQGVSGPNQALIKGITGKDGLLSTASGSRWLIGKHGNNPFYAILDALAVETYAHILAEPTLIALSGKKAVFKSGGEKGYTVTQPGGTTSANTVEFKEWGTSIEFTPIVLSEDRINITVTPKVSTLEKQEGTSGTLALASKEATTTVELGSGQSLAIAGLLQQEKTVTTSENPLLSSLPLVGSLFKGAYSSTNERELIIIITPYIVKPSSKQLKTPIDMVPRIYSPLETIITKRFSREQSKYKVHCAGFCIR